MQCTHIINVSDGYYSNENSPIDSRVSQHICPKGYWCKDGVRYPCDAGTFGDSLGLKNNYCSGSCSAGYYCPAGSSSPNQYPCGNSTVYCPVGSKLPRLVERGYYSASGSDSIITTLDAEPKLNSTHRTQGREDYHAIFVDAALYSLESLSSQSFAK